MDAFFTTREFEGRIKWMNINIRDILSGRKTIAFTADDYDGVDFFMTAFTDSIMTASVGEIKTIHRNYTKYDNFQIDYKKLKNLQDVVKIDNRIPYLVCFFDDYTIVWDITDINLEERRYNQYCTSTTADYEKGKREKEEVWLTKEESIWFTSTTL